eukprot:6013250-Amphidinium_carterae.2
MVIISYISTVVTTWAVGLWQHGASFDHEPPRITTLADATAEQNDGVSHRGFKCHIGLDVVGCNFEGCNNYWCPSHAIYASRVGGGFWCVKHKDNIPLDGSHSLINQAICHARVYCCTCKREVWPSNLCQNKQCTNYFCNKH